MSQSEQDQTVVTPLDIIQFEGSKWLYNNRELTKGEIDNLKNDASVIGQLQLWKILVNEGKYHAQKRAIIDTKVADREQKLSILEEAQAYHDVVVMMQKFIESIINRR